jgi:hypothetical protein
VSKALTGSSAAPTYFGPVEFSADTRLVDGGVEANNPSERTLQIADEVFKQQKPCLLISLGTGFPELRVPPRGSGGMSSTEWLRHVIQKITSGGKAHELAKQRMESFGEGHYYLRYNPTVEGPGIDLSDTSDQAFRDLQTTAQSYIKSNSSLLRSGRLQMISSLFYHDPPRYSPGKVEIDVLCRPIARWIFSMGGISQNELQWSASANGNGFISHSITLGAKFVTPDTSSQQLLVRQQKFSVRKHNVWRSMLAQETKDYDRSWGPVLCFTVELPLVPGSVHLTFRDSHSSEHSAHYHIASSPQHISSGPASPSVRPRQTD